MRAPYATLILSSVIGAAIIASCSAAERSAPASPGSTVLVSGTSVTVENQDDSSLDVATRPFAQGGEELQFSTLSPGQKAEDFDGSCQGQCVSGVTAYVRYPTGTTSQLIVSNPATGQPTFQFVTDNGGKSDTFEFDVNDRRSVKVDGHEVTVTRAADSQDTRTWSLTVQ